MSFARTLTCSRMTLASTERPVTKTQAVGRPQVLSHHRLAAQLAGVGMAASIMVTPAVVFATPDLELGADVFNGNCAACHTGGGNSVKPGYTLEKSAIDQYLETPVGNGFNVTNIIYQVTNGKNAMPAWGDRLDDEEIESVAAYVYDQADGDKW